MHLRQPLFGCAALALGASVLVPFLSIIGLLAYITLKMVNLIHNILQKTPKKRTLSANYVEREGKYYLLACDISGEETNEDRYIQRTRRKGEVRICEFLMAALNILKGKPEHRKDARTK